MTRRRTLATLAALLLGLVLADFGAGAWMLEEGLYGGRPLPPFDAMTPERQEWLDGQRQALERGQPPSPLQGFDAELGWTNRPGEVERDATCSINSIGARGRREYAPLPPPGTLRVVCVGESFVFGSQVDDGQDFPAQLEALDPSIEAINLGVGGYGTDQALLRFRRDGRDLGAQVVCMGIMLESIGRNVNRLRALYYPPTRDLTAKPRFFLEDGELKLVPHPFATRREMLDAAAKGTIRERIRDHEYWLGDDPLVPYSTIARILAAEPAYARRRNAVLWRDVEGEPFRVTLALLEAFHREALAAGAEHALVLVFCSRSELGRLRRGHPPYWKTLHEALAARGVPFLDIGITFAAMPEVERLYVHPHLNPRGNQIVAETLHAWLRERYPTPKAGGGPEATR